MESSHRANLLVTACLKTPVDPHTKVPLASYERVQTAGTAEKCDLSLDLLAKDVQNKGEGAQPIREHRPISEHIDLHGFYFSNMEYYCKLEQLRRAHLQSMAELDLMCHKNLNLKGIIPLSNSDRTSLLNSNLGTGGKLKKSRSAHELRCGIGYLDLEEDRAIKSTYCPDHVTFSPGTSHLISPKEHISNMWRDFRVDKRPSHQQDPHAGHQTVVQQKTKGHRTKKGKRVQVDGWRPQVTEPKPFQMTIREAEIKRKSVRSRSEIELENQELRRQLEELTECQRKFRASPVPAHVHLPLYEELREREEERRRQKGAAEQRRLRDIQKPFSFLEREEARKEQKDAGVHEQKEHGRCLFRAKPVPRAVREAASGERQKEEQLYREIKKQMRARELLLGASTPPSMTDKRLAKRHARKEQLSEESNRSHQPKRHPLVPDFDATFRRFQKQLENEEEILPGTACKPLKMCNAGITPRKERNRIQQSPRNSRWHLVASSTSTPSSSLCSSLSGSLEYLPSKITDAAKKRQEAVRKVLEERKRAEEEEEGWKEKRRQKERKLQKLVATRAQANDPHVALAQMRQCRLKEFRKQDQQRRREYREEMKEIQERVKSRPLLLERVAQMNARQAAERRYAEALHTWGIGENFVDSKARDLKSKKQKYGPSISGTPTESPPLFRHRGDLAADEPAHDSDLVDVNTDLCLPGDFLTDYKDDDQTADDEPTDEENKVQKQNQECKYDSDSHEELDENYSYEDDLEIDADEDKYQSDEDENMGSDRSRSRHSNTSKESDDGRSMKDRERTVDDKWRSIQDKTSPTVSEEEENNQNASAK